MIGARAETRHLRSGSYCRSLLDRIVDPEVTRPAVKSNLSTKTAISLKCDPEGESLSAFWPATLPGHIRSIFGLSASPEVSDLAAGGVVSSRAIVKNEWPGGGDLIPGDNPCDPVGKSRLAFAAQTEHAVAVAVDAPGPQKTAGIHIPDEESLEAFYVSWGGVYNLWCHLPHLHAVLAGLGRVRVTRSGPILTEA